MKQYLMIGAAAFVLGAGSMAYVSQQAQASAQQPQAQTYRMLELFGDVLDTVERQYVTDVDQSKLIPLLTKALQEALDKIETLETRLSDAGIA